MAVIVGDDVRRWKLLHPFAAIATPLCRNCCAPMLQLLRPDAAIVAPRCKKYFVPMYSPFHRLELTFHLPELTFQRLEHKTYRANVAQPALYGAIRPSD